MAPMRDGARLHTSILLPDTEAGPWPTILLRTPYMKLRGGDVFQPFRPFVQDGYALTVQSCRGTGQSEGQLEPMAQEFADGHDTVEWIAARPWSNGRVGTLGASYEGFTALAATVDTDRVKVVISDGTPAHAFDGWPGQRGILNSLIWWLHLVETGEDIMADAASMAIMTNSRPLSDLDLNLFGERHGIWRTAVSHMEQYSPFWARWSLENRLHRLCAPMLHLQAGQEWEDDALDVFLGVTANPCTPEVGLSQRFVLGSHSHGEAVYTPFAQTLTGELIRKYLAKYLKEEDVDLSEVPYVQYCLQNAGEWRSSETWPVATSTREFFLHAGATPADPGTLSETPASVNATALYVFDPELDDACSQADYTGYVIFEGDPLNATTDVVGGVEAVLHLNLDTPDTDLFVYVYEITSGQQWQYLHGSRIRLRYRDSYSSPTPVPQGEAVEITVILPAVAYRIPAGSRLAAFFVSSECGFSENPNTGGSIADETAARPAAISILTGPDHPSRLRLPVVEGP